MSKWKVEGAFLVALTIFVTLFCAVVLFGIPLLLHGCRTVPTCDRHEVRQEKITWDRAGHNGYPLVMFPRGFPKFNAVFAEGDSFNGIFFEFFGMNDGRQVWISDYNEIRKNTRLFGSYKGQVCIWEIQDDKKNGRTGGASLIDCDTHEDN